jgi:hypothetical protein
MPLKKKKSPVDYLNIQLFTFPIFLSSEIAAALRAACSPLPAGRKLLVTAAIILHGSATAAVFRIGCRALLNRAFYTIVLCRSSARVNDTRLLGPYRRLNL